jgi:tetratricopeptide (TPR) repeat protein
MKNLVYLLMICLAACNVHGAEVKAIAVPNSVIAGQLAQLVIASDSSIFPKILSFPEVENIEWIKSDPSRQQSIVTGAAESRTIYWFKVLKEGTVEIPPLKAIVGGQEMMTNGVTVKAFSGANQVVSKPGSGGGESKLKDLLYGKGIVMAEGREFYVGEEIQLELNVYVAEALRYQFTSWPNFNTDKVIFRDYSSVNKENSRFEQPVREQEIVDGQRFHVYKFRTAFRSIAAGMIALSASQTCEVAVPDRKQNEDEDDFARLIRGTTYRSIPYTINIDFPELKIKALPPAPEGVESLGLIGNWLVNYSVSSKELKSGEPFTFKIEISGTGTLENFQAPKLNIPGFRIYPAEINKSSVADSLRQQMEIRYVMIPLKPGQTEIELKTAVFSTSHETYKIFNYEQKFNVVQSENHNFIAAPVVVNSAPDVKSSEETEVRADKPLTKSSILYMRKSESGGVDVPLYLNYLWAYILLLLAGPLLWLCSEWRYASRMKLENDPMLRRRRAAQSDRSRILRELKKCVPDNIDEVINNEVVPFLNDMLALPPGTSATELAQKVSDKEIAECLNSFGAASYMPGASSMDRNQLKKRIYKAVKAFSVIILLALLPLTAAAGAKKTVVKPEVPVLTANDALTALTAYDRGEFGKAADYYRSKIVQEKPDPSLLFNLGNCYCQLQDYPAALVCYERARLLAPNDSDIVENLNYIRRKLFQPQIGEIKDPAGLIKAMRDNLRPDQWLLIAAIAWAAAGCVLAWRRSLSFNKLIILLGIAALTALLSIAAAVTQWRGDYDPDIAVIMNDNVKLRSLPSESSGQVELKLQSGSKVRIIESRQEWARIHYGDADGWINAGQMVRIAPGNRLPSQK